MDHENDVGHLFVRRVGQCIGHVGASDGDFFEVVVTVAGGFRQQQESRLICQGQFSTNIREGLGVRRKTTAERVLQYLALVLFRFPHLYGRVMCGIGRLDQHKGGVVALVDDARLFVKLADTLSVKVAWDAQIPDETTGRIDLANYERQQVRAQLVKGF